MARNDYSKTPSWNDIGDPTDMGPKPWRYPLPPPAPAPPSVSLPMSWPASGGDTQVRHAAGPRAAPASAARAGWAANANAIAACAAVLVMRCTHFVLGLPPLRVATVGVVGAATGVAVAGAIWFGGKVIELAVAVLLLALTASLGVRAAYCVWWVWKFLSQ